MPKDFQKKNNPLFVVRGETVEEANGTVDYFIKKVGLEPVLDFVQKILQMLLEMIKDYPSFIFVKSCLDQLIKLLEGLMARSKNLLISLFPSLL